MWLTCDTGMVIQEGQSGPLQVMQHLPLWTTIQVQNQTIRTTIGISFNWKYKQKYEVLFVGDYDSIEEDNCSENGPLLNIGR